MAYSRSQKKVARKIYRVGAKRGESRKEIIAALETALVEANLSNPNYGDADSVGWRQERSHYGSVAKRRNVAGAANRFFDETSAQGDGRGMTPGQLAQAVQRSAFPDRYAERGGQAKDLLRWLRQTDGGSPRGNSSSVSGTTRIPGVDNSAVRQQLLQQYLATDYDPNALLSLAQGLEGAQDIPGVSIPGTSSASGGTWGGRGGRDVVTATGQSVNKMLSKAVRWDKAKVPYLWGGGHGSIAKPGDPVDCSGYVSAVLGLDTPQVSGNLASWGQPGKGKWVSVYANDGHVLMSIRDPKTKKVRWFGTSKSNPGGGAGEISPPDAGYLSRFAVRHPG